MLSLTSSTCTFLKALLVRFATGYRIQLQIASKRLAVTAAAVPTKPNL